MEKITSRLINNKNNKPQFSLHFSHNTGNTMSAEVIKFGQSRLDGGCVGAKCHHLVQNGTHESLKSTLKNTQRLV